MVILQCGQSFYFSSVWKDGLQKAGNKSKVRNQWKYLAVIWLRNCFYQHCLYLFDSPDQQALIIRGQRELYCVDILAISFHCKDHNIIGKNKWSGISHTFSGLLVLWPWHCHSLPLCVSAQFCCAAVIIFIKFWMSGNIFYTFCKIVDLNNENIFVTF